jgi:hypothetical protein
MNRQASALEHELTAQDRVFFLHIPKTAGTSLAAILEHHFHPSEILPRYLMAELCAASQPALILDDIRYIRGHFYYDAIRNLWNRQPLTITLLRDPLERFLSNFAQTQRATNLPQALTRQVQQMTLEDFLNEEQLQLRLGYCNLQTAMLAVKLKVTQAGELPPLLKALHSSPKLDLSVTEALQLLDSFAVVGLSERFQESLDLLAYTFGWRPVRDAQKLNVAPQRLRQQDLSPNSLERVAALNALDLELYAQAQHIFEARFRHMTQRLLDSYGSRAQAHLPYPLPLETLHELLEKHYERRAAKRYERQQRSSFQFKFDQAFEGLNWHLPEISPELGFIRWSGPGTQSTLDFPLAHHNDLLIQFRILTALAPDILESLRLTVNDQPIRLSRRPDPAGAGAIIFQGRIPRATLQRRPGFTRLAFEVNRTLSPQTLDPHSPDERRLGVLFNWIDIYPARESLSTSRLWQKSFLASGLNRLRRLATRLSGLSKKRGVE